MNKALMYMLLWVICIAEASGQITLSGVVKDSTGAAISGAALLLSHPDGKVLYARAEDDGRFYFKTTAMAGSTLEVYALGFASQKLTLHCQQSCAVLVVLEPQIKRLDEVIVVLDKPIVEREDTVIVSAGHFTDGSEKTVEDLLKKIPGLTVDENGTVKVGNREVAKVMVEGDDFLEKGYKILTQNMAAYAIEKIEIIRNFSANKRLKGLVREDKVALNLRLKKDIAGVLFGQIQGGGGPSRHVAKSSLMRMSSLNKHYLVGLSNSIGDASGLSFEDLLGYSTSEAFSEKAFLQPLLQGGTPRYPALQKKRTGIYRPNMVSLNSIFALGKHVKLKTTGALQVEHRQIHRREYQHVELASLSFTNSEELRGDADKHLEFADALLTWDLSQKLGMTYSVKMGLQRGRYTNSWVFNGSSISERLVESNKVLQQNIELTYQTATNSAAVVSWKHLVATFPQRYTLNSFIYEGLHSSSDSSILQEARVKRNVWLGESKWLKQVGASHKFEVKGALQFQTDEAVSFLYPPLAYKVEPSAVEGPYNHSYISLGIAWRTEATKFQHFSDIELRRGCAEILYPGQVSYFHILPKLGVSFLPSSKHHFRLSYGFQQSTPEASEVDPSFVHAGFRTFMKGSGSADWVKTSVAVLSHTIGNWGQRFFMNTFFSYTHDHQFLGSKISLSPNYSIQYRQWQNGKSAFTFYSALDQFIPSWKANVKWTVSGASSSLMRQINGAGQLPLQTLQGSLGFEFRSAYAWFLNYHTGVQWQTYRQKFAAQQSNTDLLCFLDVYGQFGSDLQLKLKADYRYFGSSNADCTFLDMELNYAVKPKKLTLSFLIDNLLNSSAFEAIAFTEGGANHSVYRLQPRWLLIKGEIRI